MKVVYSDESGTGSIKTEPLTVVAALLINMEADWDYVESAIEDIASPSVRKSLLADGEIKGKILFKTIERKRPKSQEARQMLADLLSLVPFRMTVFHGAVDRKHFADAARKDPLLERYSAQQYAFIHCLERVEHFVHARPEKLIWIEDRNYHEERRLLRSLKSHRAIQPIDLNEIFGELKYAIRFSEPHVSHILDTAYFGNSAASRALQLADICSSTIARTLTHQPFGAEFYGIINNSLATQAWGVEYGDQTQGVSPLLSSRFIGGADRS